MEMTLKLHQLIILIDLPLSKEEQKSNNTFLIIILKLHDHFVLNFIHILRYFFD
jgi:hypothetical protein